MNSYIKFFIALIIICFCCNDSIAQRSAKVKKVSDTDMQVVESENALNIPLDAKQNETKSELRSTPDKEKTATPEIENKAEYFVEPGKLKFEFKPEQ